MGLRANDQQASHMVFALLIASSGVMGGCAGAETAPRDLTTQQDAAPDRETPATTETAEGVPAGGEDGTTWAESSAADVQLDVGTYGGMRGCEGQFTEAARSFFVEVYRAAERCARESSTTGTIVFHTTIEQGGGISEFSVHEDELHDDALTSCIQESAFAVPYPEEAPDAPCVQAALPMTFR